MVYGPVREVTGTRPLWPFIVVPVVALALGLAFGEIAGSTLRAVRSAFAGSVRAVRRFSESEFVRRVRPWVTGEPLHR